MTNTCRSEPITYTLTGISPSLRRLRSVALSALFRNPLRRTVVNTPWSLEHPAVDAVAGAAAKLRTFTDAQLAIKSAGLRQRLRAPEQRTLSSHIEAGGLAMEAVRRTTNKELFPTQRL